MSDALVSKGLASGDPETADAEATPPEHPAAGVWKTLSGLRKLQVAFSDPRVRRARSAADVADAEARQLLMLRLKRAQESAARTELSLQKEAKPEAQPTSVTPLTSGKGPEKPSSEPQSSVLSESYLLAELVAVRDQLKATIEAHAAERAAWEAVCDELRERLNESLADAQIGSELKSVLEGARAQMLKAIDAHNAELRARLDELNAVTEERTALEAALNANQAASRQAADTYATERAAWETTRDELNTTLQHGAAELRQTTDAHAAERAAWAETLQQVNAAVDGARADLTNATAAHDAELEARGRELQEAASARAALEDALKAAQRERQKVVEAHEAERAAWNETRQEFDVQAGQLSALAKARAELEAALEASETSLRQSGEQYAADRADWETRYRQVQTAHAAASAKLNETTDTYASDQAAWARTHHELEARAKEFQAAAEAQAKTEEALQATAGTLRETTDAYASDRTTWDIVRRELEADINRVSVELAQGAAAHHAELKTLRREVQKAVEAHTKSEAALAKALAERQQAIDAHASERGAWDAARRELEANVHSARKEFDNSGLAYEAELKTQKHELQKAHEARTKVETALTKAQAERQQAIDARAADRAAWDATRRHLEADANSARRELDGIGSAHEAELRTHRQELQQAADARTTLEAVVTKAQAERQQAIDAHGSDRAAWDATRRQLEADTQGARRELEKLALAHEADLKTHTQELQKAADARTKFEAVVTKTQAERQQAVDAHASDRAAWEAARRQLDGAATDARAAMAAAAERHVAELEARERDLRQAAEARTKLEATLTKANAERQRAMDMRAADRAVWDATRHQLEADVANARSAAAAAAAAHEAELQARAKELEERQAAVAARAKVEAALSKTETDRQEAIAAHAADRAAWNAARHELEARLREARTVEEDRQSLQLELGQVRAEHAVLRLTHESTEQQLTETTARLHELATESEALRLRIEAEFNGDIRAELEERLYEARRLEEVGRLAGAMTPDIKELVSSIEGRGSELTAALDSSDPRRKSAEAIVACSERASGLLRQLVAFSEKQSRALAPVDVNDAVGRVEPVLTQLLGTDIDLKIAIGPAGVISAGEDDLDHLVTAVVLSARDLLPVGGSLAIETRRVESGQLTPDQPDGSVPGHFMLIITASGYGVQPAQASPALELAVQRCGGELYFDGTGNKAVFQVRFSLARPDAQNGAVPRLVPEEFPTDTDQRLAER